MSSQYKLHAIKIGAKNAGALQILQLRVLSITRWVASCQAATVRARSKALVRDRRILALTDQAVMSLANMAVSIIVARYSLKSEFGLYASDLSIVLFVTAVQSALISVPYTIVSPQLNGVVRRQYKGNTILLQVMLAAVCALVLLSIGFFSSGLRPSNNARIEGVCLCFLVLSAMFRDFARRVSYAELDFASAISLDSQVAIIQVLGIALLASIGKVSSSSAMICVAIATGFAGITWLKRSWHTFEFSLKDLAHDLGRNAELGRWLISSSILWSICIEQYPTFVSILKNPSETAAWAACFGVMSFLNPVVLALNNDVVPRIANEFATEGLDGLRKSVTKAAVISGVLTLPIVLSLYLFGGKLLTVMYGSGFSHASKSVSILATGLLIYASGQPFTSGILLLKRPGLDFTTNVACLVVFAAIGPRLIVTYGYSGAAASFLLIQGTAFAARASAFLVASKVAGEANLLGKKASFNCKVSTSQV